MGDVPAAKVERPEDLYKHATDPAERRRLQTAVIVAYRDRVVGLVRRTLSSKHWREAEQVGAIGLIVALEKFDPARGVPFWAFARHWVRHEISCWLDYGVYWRPRRQTELAKAAARLHQKPASLSDLSDDGQAEHSESFQWVPVYKELSEKLETGEPSTEDIVAEMQMRDRLVAFLSTVTDEERHLLLCEKRTRSEGGVGAGNNKRSANYLSLVERATAFVRGNDGTDTETHRDPVRRDRDAARPHSVAAPRSTAS